MASSGDVPLNDEDIVRLGIEAGMRVQAEVGPLTTEVQQQIVDDLGMRAVELAYRKPTVPDGENDSI